MTKIIKYTNNTNRGHAISTDGLHSTRLVLPGKTQYFEVNIKDESLEKLEGSDNSTIIELKQYNSYTLIEFKTTKGDKNVRGKE